MANIVQSNSSQRLDQEVARRNLVSLAGGVSYRRQQVLVNDTDPGVDPLVDPADSAPIDLAGYTNKDAWVRPVGNGVDARILVDSIGAQTPGDYVASGFVDVVCAAGVYTRVPIAGSLDSCILRFLNHAGAVTQIDFFVIVAP